MNGRDLPATFAKNLKAIRTLKGLSQRALAERLQMSYVGVNRWENGLTSPTLETVAKIAEALDVPSESLVTEVGAEILAAASA